MPRGKKQEPSVAKETKTAVKDVAVKTDDKEKESVTAEVKKEEAAKAESAVKETKSEAATTAKEEPAKEEANAAPKRRGRKPGQKKTTTTPAAKKTAAKKVEKEMVREVFFEYNHEQILTEELIERIQENYKNEGHRVSSIKTLRVYINLEARRAYYVINDKAEGKFVEF